MHANDPDMADEWEKKKKKESLSAAQAKAAHDKFKKTGELPPHLKKLVKKIKKFEKDAKVKNIVVPGLEWMSKIKESLAETERDYKDEYKKFQSSTKAKKYRAELNKYNRKKGTYGNGDGKDASHKGGKIVGFESQSKNRGRAEKSRLKKESRNKELTEKDLMNFLMKRFKFNKKKAIDTMKKAGFDTSMLKKENARQEIEEYVDGILDGMGDDFMVNEDKECMCEACWKGYEKKGMKTMFGKKYPNCVKKTKKEDVNERKFNHKKAGDDYMGGVNSPKGDTEMFSNKKGQYYIWVKPKGKKAKYIDLPKRIKNRSDADSFHDRIKKTMGESVNEAKIQIKGVGTYDDKTLYKKILDMTKSLQSLAKRGQWSKSSENSIKMLGRLWGAYSDYVRNNESVNEGPDKDLFKKLGKIQNDIYKLLNNYKSKANVPAISRSFMIGLQNQLKKDKMIESKTSDMMKAVRKGGTSGPWDIIISKNNKIVKRVSVKNLKEIPAEMNDVKKAFPNHKIGIESKGGKIVYRESVTEMNEPMFKITYKDSVGRKKTDIMRAKNHNLAKRDFNASNKGRGFKILKVVKESIDEGSCGYGIDGQLGNEPAGPHLMKKKKKKKDEASLGSMMSKKVGKHRGTRDKGEIAKILKLLIKRGNKKKDAMDMIAKNYDKVSKSYRRATPAKKAEILSSLQEAVKLKGKSKGTISHVGMPKASKGVEKLFKIVDGGFGKVGGQTVDSMSANLFKQIYDKASDDIKMKLNKKNEKQLVMIISKMWNKFGKNVSIGSSI